MLLWTLVYKFLFEHPHGPLTEEPPNYFPQKFHCLYLFLSFVSPIKTNIHSRCPCSKIPVFLWVSFISAHPEILGDIGKPGVLQSMGSRRARHDWATELSNWTDSNEHSYSCYLEFTAVPFLVYLLLSF